MIKLLKLFEKKYYVLTVGQNLNSLVYIQGDKILAYIQGDISSSKSFQNFKDILLLNKRAPIYIILDNKEQHFEKHKIVAPSSLEIDHIMHEKLKHEYDEAVFKGVINLGETIDRSNNCEYLFVTINKNETIQIWLDYLTSIPNPLLGVFALALEAKQLIKLLNEQYFPVKFEKVADYESKEWEILAAYSELSGFEYIIYCNNRFFTRRVNSGINAISTEFVVGYLENELQNILETIEYKVSDSIDIFLITNNEIKKSLTNAKVHADSFLVLTHAEINQKLAFKNNYSADNFETLIARTIIDNKRQYNLYNAKINPIIIIEKVHQYLKKILSSLLAIAILAYLYLFISFYLLNNQLVETNLSITAVTLEIAREDQEIKKLELANFNTEHKKLPKIFFATTSPIEFIAKVFALKKDYIKIREMNWSLIEEGNIDLVQTKLQLYMDFYNLDNKNLFGDISDFIKKIEDSFIGYDVFYTRESNGMVTSSNSYKVPIIISIFGPRHGK